MSVDEERIKILELAIDEQRRDYDVIHSFYDQAKFKNITFLAAALGLLGYLYTNNADGSLKNKLFIPDEPYGVIIYALGFIIYLSSIGMLLYAVKPQPWSTAFENDEEPCVSKTYIGYLEYMKSRYIKVSKSNMSSYGKKQRMLDMSLIPLVLGGTILLLLKTFGR